LLGWQGVFQVLGVACLAAAAILFFVVPEKQEYMVRGRPDKSMGFATVFRSSLFLRVAPLTTTSQSIFLSISGLWAGTWLQDVGGLERPEAANILAAMTVSMIAGFIVLGNTTAALARRGISTLTTATFSVVMATVPLILMALMEEGAPVSLCWVVFGFFGSGSILYYAALSQRFPSRIAGRVNTALNLLVFVGAFAMQWGIGVVIDHWSPGEEFSGEGYRAAFAGAVVLQVMALAWYLVFSSDVGSEENTS